MNQIVAESLAGSKRIGRPAENPHRLWQLVAGGFQMTLLTDVHLTFRIQSGWIDNGLSNRLDPLPAASQRHMLRPRTMAALAVDTRG